MNRLIYFLILLVILLQSCRNTEEQDSPPIFNNASFQVISIDTDLETDTVKHSDFARDFEYIELEANENSLIGEIDKMEVDDKYIYILDRDNTNSLFVFDRSGNFITKVGSRGKGPGEYTTISDFAIAANNMVVIHDFYKNSLLFFENFEFKNERKIEEQLESVTFDGSHYYFKLFVQNQISTHELMVTNKNLVSHSKHFPVPEGNRIGYTMPYNFRHYGDSISFFRFFRNKVYRLKDGKIFPKYYFDFKGNDAPHIYSATEPVVNVDNTSFLRTKFFENPDIIFFSFSKSRKGWFALYNKHTGALKYAGTIRQDVGEGVTFFSNDKDFIYGVIYPQDLEYSDYMHVMKEKNKDIYEVNPVLAIARFGSN